MAGAERFCSHLAVILPACAVSVQFLRSVAMEVFSPLACRLRAIAVWAAELRRNALTTVIDVRLALTSGAVRFLSVWGLRSNVKVY